MIEEYINNRKKINGFQAFKISPQKDKIKSHIKDITKAFVFHPIKSFKNLAK